MSPYFQGSADAAKFDEPQSDDPDYLRGFYSGKRELFNTTGT